MKYLSDYMQDKQTTVLNRYGAFFAFSNKQFDEKKQKDIKYMSLGAGLIAPSVFADQLVTDLEAVAQEARDQDIAENGIKAIIHRELANHECQITMDYSEVVGILSPYGITEAQVSAEWSEFWQICIDNDYF